VRKHKIHFSDYNRAGTCIDTYISRVGVRGGAGGGERAII
jgi:hypothetical protein